MFAATEAPDKISRAVQAAELALDKEETLSENCKTLNKEVCRNLI